MRLKFEPPPEHADCPYRQVHYGYDFSGGAVCDVQDPLHIAKLLGSRHFVQVQEPTIAEQYHDDNRPMRRRKRPAHGDDNETAVARPSAD